ncbi:MAG TPA: ribonuclease R [Bacteroidia bacterium]|nr:ribonuclease R [Bacteroidia bacterium]
MSKKFKNKNQPKSSKYLFEDVLKALNANPSRTYNYKQVASLLRIEDHSQKLLLNAILEKLTAQGLVKEVERGKFQASKTGTTITGKVDMTQSGSAFIISAESEKDIFVSNRKTLNAYNGDMVRVLVYPQNGSRRPEGEIVEIVSRAKEQFVGTLQVSANFAFLVPDNAKTGTDIYIPLDKIGAAKNGQKVIAHVTDWATRGHNPIGEVVRVLGNAGEHETEIHAILAEFGLPYEFPKDVEKFADLLPVKISESEISKRRDFRKVTTFTIDPFDAKDFDDALSIEKLDNGNWEIGVHIADVSHYVKPGNILDKEALERATSVYLVDRVVPMLPEILSNNICSLRPHEDKLCFSAVFEMDENAKVLNEWFGRTVIYSDHRFSYEEVQKIIETSEGEYVEEIMTLDRLAKKLRAERFKKGSIAFDKLEVKFHLDENANPTGVYFKEMKDSNKLIEDFMLLANRKVAEYVGKSRNAKEGQADKNQKKQSNRYFVYRVHDTPNEDKLEALSVFVTRFGYRLKTNSDKAIAESMNSMLKEVHGKPESGMIETLAVRCMSKAIYTTNNIGHYGLGFEYYSHFTSPIRRYPDVLAHRLLQHYLDIDNGIPSKAYIDEAELEAECKHSSEREKLAADAERASIKYKQVQFLKDKIGEEYDGIISGVTEWGIFVELTENHCEGMVSIRDMKDDSYFFDEDNYCIRGRKPGNVFTLGNMVRIEIKSADLVKKQLNFVMVKRTEVKKAAAEEKTADKKIAATKPSEKGKVKTPAKKGEHFNDEWGFEI